MATILIVDDETSVLFTLRELIEERGHVVREARSGEEALPLIDGVDLVITDLSMPGMDGLELLARLHALYASLPVILLTARGSERVAVRAMKEGAYDYLTKPFDVDEMTLAIERAIEVASLRGKARHLDEPGRVT